MSETRKLPVMHAGGQVAAIVPTSFEEAYRFANLIVSANMAPKSYDRNTEKVMVGLLAGMEVGLSPMQSLQSIAVINNTPTLYGDGMLGLVRSSGLLEDLEETFNYVGDDVHSATCRANRVGQETPIIRTFSLDDAERARLLSKEGPWEQYPTRMLQMRARSWALRDGFADILKGLHDAAEEDGGQMVDITPPPEPQREDFEKQEAELDAGYVDTVGPPSETPPPEPKKQRKPRADKGTKRAKTAEPAPTPPAEAEIAPDEAETAPEPAPEPIEVEEAPPATLAAALPHVPDTPPAYSTPKIPFVTDDQPSAIASVDEVRAWVIAALKTIDASPDQERLVEFRTMNKNAWSWIEGRYADEGDTLRDSYKRTYKELPAFVD